MRSVFQTICLVFRWFLQQFRHMTILISEYQARSLDFECNTYQPFPHYSDVSGFWVLGIQILAVFVFAWLLTVMCTTPNKNLSSLPLWFSVSCVASRQFLQKNIFTSFLFSILLSNLGNIFITLRYNKFLLSN